MRRRGCSVCASPDIAQAMDWIAEAVISDGHTTSVTAIHEDILPKHFGPLPWSISTTRHHLKRCRRELYSQAWAMGHG